MHHYFEAITNTSGDSLIGYFARVVDPATNNGVAIAADNNGTPISTVSGVDNAAKTDAYGNLDFYVQPGTYHLDIYAPNATSLQLRVQNVAMNSSKGDTGEPGPQGNVGASDAAFTTLAALNAIDPVAFPSPRLAAPSGADNGVANGLFNYQLGNFTGRTDVVQVNGIPITTGALVRQSAGSVAISFGANTVPATVQDALMNPGAVPLTRWMVGQGVSLDFAIFWGIQAGYRDFTLPPGRFRTNGQMSLFDVTDPTKGVRLTGAGQGVTIIDSYATDIAINLGGSSPCLRDITVNMKNGAYGGAVGSLERNIINGLVERVTVTQEPGCNCNQFTFDWNNNGALNGLSIIDCNSIKPQRMGLEALSQNRPLEQIGLRIVNFRCFDPTDAGNPSNTGFAPAISLDGNFTNPRIENFYCEDGIGSHIELIKVQSPEVINPTWVRPKNAILIASNAIPVKNLLLVGGRIVNPIQETSLNLQSAQNAIIDGCELLQCYIYNGIAPDTTIQNCKVVSGTRFCVFNGGGGGGGPRLVIRNTTMDNRTYNNANGACYGGSVGGSVQMTGNSFYKSPAAPDPSGYVTIDAGVQVAATANFKDGIAVPSGY